MNVIIKYGADLGDFETGTDKVIKDLTKVESKGNDVTATTNEFINTLKQGIAGVTTEKLTSDVDKLNKKLIEAGKDSKYTASELKNIGKAANEVGKELGTIAKTNDIKKLGVEVEGTTKKFTSLKAELRALKQQISSGELEGVALQKATLRAAQLTDELGDLSTKLKTLGSDTRVFDTMVEGARLATGAFSVAQGAVALFGDENEDLQKALIKLNAVMAISQGLQEISQLTQKETAIGIRLNTGLTYAQTVAQTTYNFVVGTSTGLMKAFRLALAGTGIGLLIIGLIALIANFDKIKRALSDNSEGFQKFKENIKLIFPPLYALIEGVQYLIKNIDKLKSVFAGIKGAISEGFSGVGEIVSNVLSGSLSNVVNDFKKLGTDVSNAYTDAYIAQEQVNKQKRLNEFAKASQEFYTRQIELLKAQGKETYNLEAGQINRKVNLLINALDEQERINLREIKGIELKLKGRQSLSDEETAIYNSKSEKITAILEAENERDIFYANREREQAEKYEAQRKERAAKVLEKRLKEFQLFKDNIIKQLIEFKALEQTTEIEFNDIKATIPDSQIQSLRTTFYERLQDAFQNADSKNFVGDLPKAIGDAAKLIDDSFAAQSFSGVLQGVSELFDGITKEIDKVKNPLDSRVNEIAQGVLAIGAAATNILSGLLAKQIENLDKLIDKQRERVNKATDIADEGNAKLLEAEENKLQRLETMRKKDGEKQKAIAIVQAVINTALGITNAFATAPNIIAGIILAALTAAAGAVQIGLISSQTFAKGGELPMGLIDAPSHNKGGAKFTIKGRKDYVGEYEGGEYILNKKTTAKNIKWLDYINKNNLNIDELFKSNQMANIGGITIEKSIEMNELKNEISELKNIMRNLPERMPRTNVALDENGFAVSVASAMSRQSTIRNNIHD